MDKISAEELKQLVLKARKNDDVAFSTLCKIYEGMLHKSVSAFEDRIDLPREDIYQEALLAFSRAAYKYDLENNEVTFGLFSKICVKNALISLERKSNSRKRRREKNAEMPKEVKDQKDAESIALWTAGSGVAKLLEENLSAFERQVLGMFAEGMSYAEIAKSMKVSKKKVDNTLYRLRKKLKKAEVK